MPTYLLQEVFNNKGSDRQVHARNTMKIKGLEIVLSEEKSGETIGRIAEGISRSTSMYKLDEVKQALVLYPQTHFIPNYIK